MMTITDIFDFKDELDEVLSKIGGKSEIFFKLYIEQLEEGTDEDIMNAGYMNSVEDVKTCISDVVDDDWAEEIFDKLDSSDLVFPGDDADLQELYKDEEYDSYIVSYAIELHVEL